MIFDAAAVRRNFSRAALSYEDHDWLQWEVAQRLLELPQLTEVQPQTVVDSGCGTGRLTEVLKQRWPKARVVGVDWAPGMLQQARRRSRWRRPIEWLCADLTALPLAPASVDLLVCNLALQWHNDVAGVFNRWRRVLRPGGLLIFATFGPRTLEELRAAWAVVDQQPHVSPFPDLQQLGDWLQAAGYRDPMMSGELITATYGEVMALLRELKALGAHNAHSDRNRQLTGKSALQRMQQAYQSMSTADGRIPATWEVYYGAAWGPPEGQPVRGGDGEVATFSVDALRGSRRR
ncbi:MAG: malonyl-ACP O-methyltransferase BioC [Wenzhouxiangellaceae bacterium]